MWMSFALRVWTLSKLKWNASIFFFKMGKNRVFIMQFDWARNVGPNPFHRNGALCIKRMRAMNGLMLSMACTSCTLVLWTCMVFIPWYWLGTIWMSNTRNTLRIHFAVRQSVLKMMDHVNYKIHFEYKSFKQLWKFIKIK